MKRTIVFDLESAPLPEPELKAMMPEFEPPGNLKDPAKIAAAIEEKKRKWIEDAALDALTGRVLAIGLMIDEAFILISEPATEATMLHEFWDAITDVGYLLHRVVGFNINLFDLPFMIRRSWKLGVSPPREIRQGRYWNANIVDIRDVWQCGDRQSHGSLDTIAKHLGVGAKTGSGKDFAALWAQDKEKATEYLKNDLQLTSAIAKKLGVL